MINKKTNTARLLVPVWGIILFIILYFLAASLYPGGSDVNKTEKGFNWLHNYWCELMAPLAINGDTNSARPVAISGMFVLAISLGIFWYDIPNLFRDKKAGVTIIRYCGVGSMLALPLFFTGHHDLTINLAGGLGCIAIVALLINLYRYRLFFLFYLGMGCLFLCGLNNYVYYYNNDWMDYLPVIQKISFVIFLLWFILLTLQTKKNYLSA